jgi:hypothetical protein
MQRMSYNMQFLDSVIFISAQDIDSVHKALIDLAKKNSERIPPYVDTEVLSRSKTLEDAFEEWSWKAEFYDDGELVNLYFVDPQKVGAEDTLFQTIAPWVKDGSYILVRGEEGEVWRWFFNEGVCKVQQGRIVFEDDPIGTLG